MQERAAAFCGVASGFYLNRERGRQGVETTLPFKKLDKAAL